MHVVPKEPRGAPMQTTCAFDEAMAIRFNFRNIVVGTNRNGAERPWMCVGDPLVVHRHVEEARRPKRLAGWLDFLDVSAEGFLPLVETEDGLERWQFCSRVRCVTHKSVVETVANGALEGLVQDPTLAHRVHLVQLAFELGHVGRRPLLHNRCVESAELCDMKERPRSLDGCGRA